MKHRCGNYYIVTATKKKITSRQLRSGEVVITPSLLLTVLPRDEIRCSSTLMFHKSKQLPTHQSTTGTHCTFQLKQNC
ncbi:hypothetical protein Mapa_002181 [Marchantia paleacea]|nr:hypothetical protein Mapa_002181 [Marchantia paleacea]